MYYFFYFLFSIATLPCFSDFSFEAEALAQKIFFNECGGKQEKLLWWNPGENFASLGIGHFIWYPKDVQKTYEETFPALLAFFRKKNVNIPSELLALEDCLWTTREDFMKDKSSEKHLLQELLSKTIPLQAAFIEERFQNELPEILKAISQEKREEVQEKITTLQKTPEGKFALIDYLHFKGKGLLESEQYRAKGWGLKQVLEEMPANASNPLRSFVETAKRLLKERVENSPPEKNEKKWLAGWLERVERYF